MVTRRTKRGFPIGYAQTEIETIDRRRCRETFERRFSDARMTDDYEQVYHQLVEKDQSWTR